MDLYWSTFVCAILISSCLAFINHRSETQKAEEQLQFQRHYLYVYTLAYFADWLKGPYVYALYESYGLSEHYIALLFIAGFGASGVSGPFVGALADKFGRKKCTLAYFLVYIASALCKPFNNFHVLLLGRLLGGIGTSLLTTTLESWMVAEHHKRKYPQALLDDTFALSTLCNSASAVIAGLLAQFTADQFGYLAPFIVAILPLTIGFYLCRGNWAEDEQTTVISVISGFQEGLRSMDDNLWIIGITQSLFLGSMYTFVFLWTPAMDSGGDTSPYGLIFATFMAMISIGSGMFKRVSHVVEKIPFVLLPISATLLGATILALGNSQHVFITFALFEMMCGLMFPTYGSLRSVYIPNEYRTVIMNIYRIPLNVFVVIVLLNKKNMSLEVAFGVCSCALIAATFMWRYFKPDVKISDGQAYERGQQIDEEEDFGDIEDYELDSNASNESDI